MNPEVPLVVPEVNAEDIKWNNGIIANPNCSTIQALVALKPLHDKYKIKRIIYSTYQAVSGAGLSGFNDLKNGYTGEPQKKIPLCYRRKYITTYRCILRKRIYKRRNEND